MGRLAFRPAPCRCFAAVQSDSRRCAFNLTRSCSYRPFTAVAFSFVGDSGCSRWAILCPGGNRSSQLIVLPLLYFNERFGIVAWPPPSHRWFSSRVRCRLIRRGFFYKRRCAAVRGNAKSRAADADCFDQHWVQPICSDDHHTVWFQLFEARAVAAIELSNNSI